MSEGVRIGQIGCGRHGRLKLARALASVGDADLVSCADLDEGAALRTAREFGFARHYQDYGEMLAKEELDGVVVALPHHMLAEAAVAAANAGCNVFVEKPVGVNKAQAVGLREAADRAGVTVMVGYAFRFDPARRTLKSLIEQGALGTITQVCAGFSSPPFTGSVAGWYADPTKGGGPLFNIGGHITDAVLWMVDSAAQRVYGEVLRDPESGLDKSAGYTIRFENGAIATVLCFSSTSSVNFIDVIGSKGRARTEWPSGKIQHVQGLQGFYYEDDPMSPVHNAAREYGDSTTIRSERPYSVLMFEEEMRVWVRSIALGEEPPIGIDAGINVLAVLDAVVESGRTGVPVQLASPAGSGPHSPLVTGMNMR